MKLPSMLSGHINCYIGPVYSLEKLLYDASSYKLQMYLARCFPGRTPDGGLHSLSGFGSDIDDMTARCKAVGEALERIALLFGPPDSVVATSKDVGNLGAEYVQLDQFIRDDAVRLEFQELDKTQMRYVPGLDLTSNKPVFLPREVCCFNTTNYEDSVLRVVNGSNVLNSTGAALAESKEIALAKAIAELIERDIFMLTWYTRSSHSRFHADQIPGLYRKIVSVAGADTPEICLINLSHVYQIPAVMALAFGPGRRIGIGCAVNLTLEDAAWSAVAECMSVYNNFGYLLKALKDITDICTIEDHLYWYTQGDGDISLIQNLACGTWKDPDKSYDFASWSDFTRRALEEVSNSGAEVFAAEVTPDFLRDSGLHCIKAVSPQLLNLDITYTPTGLSSPRISCDWVKQRFDDCKDYCRDPHPFP